MNPFLVAQESGNRFARQNIARRQEERDISALDNILSNALQSNDPGALDDAMSQILSQVSQDRQPQALKVLQSRQEMVQSGLNAAREQLGLQEAGIPPEIAALPKELRAGELKRLREQQEQTQSAEGALDVVRRMRDLGKTGHLGPKISQLGGLGFISGKVRKDRSEYEQLGKSLISFASNIPIRNQAEFNTLAEKIFDPTLTDATREGLLNAMERIIQNSISGEAGVTEQPQVATKKDRRPLTVFVGA